MWHGGYSLISAHGFVPFIFVTTKDHLCWNSLELAASLLTTRRQPLSGMEVQSQGQHASGPLRWSFYLSPLGLIRLEIRLNTTELILSTRFLPGNGFIPVSRQSCIRWFDLSHIIFKLPHSRFDPIALPTKREAELRRLGASPKEFQTLQLQLIQINVKENGDNI